MVTAAAYGRNPSVVRLLLAAGADPAQLDEALTKAASLNPDPAMTRIVLEHGTNLDASEALHWAAGANNAEVVGLLLAAGADPNRLSNDVPALGRSFGNCPDVVQLLLAAGADPNLNSGGGTAFMVASLGGLEPQQVA